MNRRQRRDVKFGRSETDPRLIPCEHGYVMKTDGNGNPLCPHGCGFNESR